LYADDGVVGRLVDMIENNVLKYDELTDIVNLGEVAPTRLDPLEIYAWQKKCSCKVGHWAYIQAPDWFPDPWKMDLEAALKILDDR